eukprot:UN18431
MCFSNMDKEIEQKQTKHTEAINSFHNVFVPPLETEFQSFMEKHNKHR